MVSFVLLHYSLLLYNIYSYTFVISIMLRTTYQAHLILPNKPNCLTKRGQAYNL
jgi:hypothetical protein